VTSDGDRPPFEAEFELPTRRAVVLVIDLVESVRLMGLDERGLIARWQAFLAHVNQVVLPATEGRLVKSLGDGLMVEFSSASRAVQAANRMHDWMAARCEPLAGGRKLALRAGIHATNIFDATTDIYGIGVNLAARVATLAEAGETVATVEARDLLSDPLDADVEDLGDCHLKHVDHPVRAYRLGPALETLSLPSHGSYESELRASVAVIPFTCERSTARARGIADLIADGIIGQLSLSPSLHVVSRLSSVHFKDRGAPLQDIAARLSVQYVVSGTYDVSGPTVTIRAELADATTGHVIGSNRVAGNWRDLLSVDSALIHDLSDAIHRKLLDTAVSKAIVKPLPALNDYELFLGGVSMMHRANATEFDTSRRMLESLTERHRRVALPHAWLGKWYVLQAIQGAPSDPPASAAIALQHTGRALDLEPSSALALAIEGFVYCHLKKDLDTAQARLREACSVNPSEGFAWLFLAVLHAFKGDPEPALDSAHRALALSPMDPLRYYYESLTASCEFGAGHHDEAIRWCEQSRRRNRQHLSTLRILIAANMAADRPQAARAAAEDLLRIRPGYTVAAYEARSVAALFPFGQEIARAMRASGVP
jgi:adenylate cyclase